MRAIVLSAGEGAHFRPLTITRPKGMSIVAGKPILQHTVEALAEAGVREVHFVVGYKPERVRSFFGSGRDFGIEAHYVAQERPEGTGAAVRLAARALGDGASESLVVFGDNLYGPDLVRRLLSVRGDALVAAWAAAAQRHGTLVAKNGRLLSYEYPTASPAGLVNTGLMKLSPDFFMFLEAAAPETALQIPHALDAYAKAGHAVHVLAGEEGWEEAETPWDLLRINERLLGAARGSLSEVPSGVRVEGPVALGRNVGVHAGAQLIGPAHVGHDCEIREGAIVGPNVSLRNNVHVGSHTEVRNAIVNNNVYLDSQCIVRFSILDDSVRLGPFAVVAEGEVPGGPGGAPSRRGSVIGPDARLGTRVTVRPGSILGEGVVVADHQLVGSLDGGTRVG